MLFGIVPSAKDTNRILSDVLGSRLGNACPKPAYQDNVRSQRLRLMMFSGVTVPESYSVYKWGHLRWEQRPARCGGSLWKIDASTGFELSRDERQSKIPSEYRSFVFRDNRFLIERGSDFPV